MCDGSGPPGDNAIDSAGPIQAMAFVVPGASSQTVISSEEAREIFGMGGNGGATHPWTTPSHYFVSNAGTGTQQLIAHAIGVPGNQFWGLDVRTRRRSDQTLKVLMGVDADEAIGIISVDSGTTVTGGT